MYTVLIADDEAIVRMMLSSMIDWDEMELKLAGCVSNGREALAYLEQHPAIPPRPKTPSQPGLRCTG